MREPIETLRQHLIRLKDMGVNIIWLMPLQLIGEENRKGVLGSPYSIKDYKSLDPRYGDESQLKHCIDEAHGLGMKVILDWVTNHTAWDHEWTESNPNYYLRIEDRFISPFDWTDVIQLDYKNEWLKQDMIQQMKFWINSMSIDGFRLDMAHLVPPDFWIKARAELSKCGRELLWLAETENKVYADLFDVTYTWRWMHATEDYFKGIKSLEELKLFLLNDDIPGYRMYFTSNHDENSWNGTEYDKFGDYAQSLAVFNATFPRSIPLIYNGQEIPLYRQLPFFESAPISWSQPLKLQDFYTELHFIRKLHPQFFGLNQQWHFWDNPSLFAFSVINGTQKLNVLLNWSKDTITVGKEKGQQLVVHPAVVLSENSISINPGGYYVYLS